MSIQMALSRRRGRHRILTPASAAALAAFAGLARSGATASAAVLTGSFSTSVTGPVNLTTEGTTDWAIWNYSASPIGGGSGSQTAAPSNRKAAVTPAIGSATTLVGVARGTSNSPPTLTYTYADGTSPTTLSPAAAQGVLFDSTLDNTGAGFTFNIAAGPAGVPQVARLYLSGFDTKPTLTATLPGATSYVDSSVTYVGARPVTVYTLNYTPDNAGDVLAIKYQSTTLNGTNANADLQAVTVALAPEPSAAGLLAVGAAGCLARRRRR